MPNEDKSKFVLMVCRRLTIMYRLDNFEIVEYEDFKQGVLTFEKKGFRVKGRSDLSPCKFEIPFDWSEDRYNDRNWMYQIHAWRMLDMYMNALLKDRPNHKQYLDKILIVIEDWFNFNIKGKGCAFTWYDMATGLRALKIAFLVIICQEYGTPLDTGFNMELLVENHFKHLSNPSELSPGNHGLFQLNGLMALAWALPDYPGSQDCREYAAEKMSSLLARQLGRFGVHTEHSPNYHFFALDRIRKLLGGPWWRTVDFEESRFLLERAEIAKYWLVSPDKRCVPVGDTTPRLVVDDFAGLCDWPHVRNVNTLGAKLDGYGVVRTDTTFAEGESSFLFFQAGFHSGVHKHSDCLSFVWQEKGEYLLVDSGSYGYQKDEMRAYFTSTRAHNTIEIDNKSYSNKAADAYGSALRDVEPFGRGWKLSATVNHKPFDVLHERTIIFLPARFILALDTLKPYNKKKRRYTVWWHFNPNHTVSKVDCDQFRIQVSGLRNSGIIEGSFCCSHSESPPVLTLARGIEAPEKLGWISTAYLKYTPTTSAGFHIESSDTILLATLFEIRDVDASLSSTLKCAGNKIVVETAGGKENCGFPSDLVLNRDCTVHFKTVEGGLYVDQV
jgi:hypothetical protein